MENRDSLLATILQSAGLLMFGRFFEMGLSFVAKILMARFLGKVNYGSVSIGISILLIASTVGLLGLHAGVSRYLPRYAEDSEVGRVLRSALSVALPTSVVTAVVVYAAADPLAVYVFHEPSVSPIIETFALAIPLVALMKLGISAAQGTQTTWPKVVMEMVSMPLVRLTGVAVAVAVGLGSLGVASAYVLSYLVPAVIAVYFIVRHTPLFAGRGTNALRRELLVYSTPLMFSGVMGFVFSDLDTLMLGYFGNVSAVGVYNVVYPVAQLVVVFVTPMTFLFLPIMSKLHSEDRIDEMDRLFKTMTKWMVVASTPVFLFFVLFPEPFVAFVFGEEYLTGITALIVVAFGFFVHIVAGPSRSVLQSVGETSFILYSNVATAATNLVLNVVLITRYGLLGAAIATAIAYGLLNALNAYYLYRQTGLVPLTRATAKILAVMAAYGAAVFFVKTRMGVTLATVAVSVLVGALLYVVVCLRYGVQTEEIKLVLRFEEHAGLDLGPLKRVANRFIE